MTGPVTLRLRQAPRVKWSCLVIGAVACAMAPACATAAPPASRRGNVHETQPPRRHVLPNDLRHLAVAPPQDPEITRAFAPIEDPTGGALETFRAAAKRAASRLGHLRVAFWGASHTSSDLWSGHTRRLLQARYGDAGHGYVMPVRWHIGTRHQDINISASKGWKVWRHRNRTPVSIGDYGYNGVAVSSDDPKQWMELSTCKTNAHGRFASVFELWFRRRPTGGDVLVTIDGVEHRVSTRGISSPEERRWRLKDGAHVVQVRPAGNGDVYLYGMVFERDRAGAIVDQMGIPGMRGAIQLHWLESTWRRHVERRAPHLVVLAYGTNAVGDKHEAVSRFKERWRQVLLRVKRAAPKASCVLVGPTDRPTRRDLRGRRTIRPHQAKVVQAQREVALEFGCGYWDAVAVMGGAGSMPRWVEAGLATKDYVHLTRAGYELLAERFVSELLRPPTGPR